ncbi:MAG: glutamate racemase [Bacteroidota bacterium]
MSIGILDSGIGGLTIVRAIRQLLPQESIVYYGDTAYLPYGSKPVPTIRARAQRICQMLLLYPCKAIVVACNSAAAVAYGNLSTYVGHQIPVLNVIDPTLQYIAKHLQSKTVGLIGTERTIDTAIYPQRLQTLQLDVQLRTLATPLIVPAIEENYMQGHTDDAVLHDYLANPSLQGIDALILGCTHYPIIKPQIAAFYQKRKRPIDILDATHMTACALQDILGSHQLLDDEKKTEDRFFTSSLNETFPQAAQLILGSAVRVDHWPL